MSNNAVLFANIRKGETSTALDRTGVPTLDGDAVVPPIEFNAPEITLDSGDKLRVVVFGQDAIQEGRFAGADRADDAYGFRRPHFQRNIAQHGAPVALHCS